MGLDLRPPEEIERMSRQRRGVIRAAVMLLHTWERHGGAGDPRAAVRAVFQINHAMLEEAITRWKNPASIHRRHAA